MQIWTTSVLVWSPHVLVWEIQLCEAELCLSWWDMRAQPKGLVNSDTVMIQRAVFQTILWQSVQSSGGPFDVLDCSLTEGYSLDFSLPAWLDLYCTMMPLDSLWVHTAVQYVYYFVEYTINRCWHYKWASWLWRCVFVSWFVPHLQGYQIGQTRVNNSRTGWYIIFWQASRLFQLFGTLKI